MWKNSVVGNYRIRPLFWCIRLSSTT